MGAEALLYIALVLANQPRPSAVSVEGDARVELVDPQGVHHEPGPLQPGLYTVLATFPGRRPRRAANLYLPRDHQLRLRCVSGFFKCTVVDPHTASTETSSER